MASLLGTRPSLVLIIVLAGLAWAQQHCYYAPGSQYQVDGLVPCLDDISGYSACCLQGDTCLAGNACYNYEADTTYQYGCTDLTYKDDSCPFKCGWSPDQSPWVALEYCDEDGVEDTWVCHSPESCGCTWRSTYGILALPPRGCKDMGNKARVGAYGPGSLLPYVVLPSEAGGSTGYFSGTTTSDGTPIVSPTTAKSGYTPDSIGPITYATPPPKSIVQLFNNAPAPGEGTAIFVTGASSGLQPPIPTDPLLAKTSSFPASFLAGITTGLSTGNGGGNSGGSGGSNGPSSTSNNNPSSTSAGAGGSGNNGGSSSNDNSGGGLPTGSKVGIGVGIAGAVCLIAAIALVWWVLKRRKRPSEGARPQDPDYTQGYHEKTHDSYASEAPATYYDAERRGSPSPGVYEAPYHTPQEEEAVKHRLSPLGPQELAGSPVAEMESGSTTPNRSPRMAQT